MRLIVFILLVSPFLCFSQKEILDSSRINKIVHKIDSLNKKETSSTVYRRRITSKSITENWQQFDNKQFSRIVIDYTIDSAKYSVAYKEKYYFQGGSLIYACESETFFRNTIEDGTTWTGEFYFSDGKLIDHVTRGHGRSESDDWDPEKEVLDQWKKRKAELKTLK